VRLVYLDEAGTDFKAPVLAVAGVLVHGDYEWPEVDKRIRRLIDEFIPEPDRPGFVFHATDIFHGSGYFDRRKQEWDSLDKRLPIINGLASIIDDLGLPVVFGHYTKDKYGIGVLTGQEDPKILGAMVHGNAAADCLIQADRWLERFAPDELATVVHEDGAATKVLIKRAVSVLRNPDFHGGLSTEELSELGMPLKRIIDTVHFADKGDARPLQLADLCAFVLGRALKDMPIPVQAFRVIWKLSRWHQKPTVPKSEPSSEEQPS
jgi:Protein of unknown function (DUF3800)